MCGSRSPLRFVSRLFSVAVGFATVLSLPAVAGDSGYAGDQACVACHADEVNAYRSSAHALTSQPATSRAIKGSFAAGANVLRTSNPNLLFVMTSEGGRNLQTAMLRTSATEELNRSESFDLIVGSGRKGQTYLYWDANLLCELPVSWWAESNTWINSPGYPDGTAVFDRPVPGRCLECHATSFHSLAPPNRYEKASLELGISCEKCHGPAAEHAHHSSQSPRASAGPIVNPAKLPRARQMDLCALCHAGAGQPVRPPLSYQVGANLSDSLTFPPAAEDAHLDVHASQVEMLEQSRCFRGSTMTCSTCHNVHQTQRDPEAFAARCLECHETKSCSVARKLNGTAAHQCVTCHMPLEATAQIVIARILGTELRPRVRNHRIAIYPAVK